MRRLNAAHVTERLAHTRQPDDPRAVRLPDSATNWPRHLAGQLAQALKPAGVLIPVFDRGTELTVLLTKRSAALKHHAGQVAFPGGRMEESDRDIVATALRETHEEVGIAPERVAVTGYLDPMPTITGYAVTPVVGFVETSVTLAIDRTEVEQAFEVPLPFLMDRGNEREGIRHYQGRDIPVTEFQFAGHRIWGATANMLIELRKLLDN